MAAEAAESVGDAVPRTHLSETSFAHMARATTEERSAGMSRWVADHVNQRRRYYPQKGQKIRKELRQERKALAGRFYQLLSGHAVTGGYLCRRGKGR